MKMNLTFHCIGRLRQRGRNNADISIIIRYGKYCNGVILLTHRRASAVIKRLNRWLKRHPSPQFQKRAGQVRRLINRLEKLVNWMAVVSPEESVITIYPADKRRQKKFMRGGIRAVEGL